MAGWRFPIHEPEPSLMPRAKPRMTAKEQKEAFDRETKRRLDAGLPSVTDADANIDELIRRSIKDHGA